MSRDRPARARPARIRPARDLATEAQTHADVRATFVKHALTRLPLIGALVITINLFVQVRGDVGLAVSVAQHLTFSGLLVVVLLNLATYIMIGVMVAAMPLVFDPGYNFWTRVVGSGVLLLLGAVLANTASWLLLAGLAALFLAIGIILIRSRRAPEPSFSGMTIGEVLRSPVPPLDSGLRALWAEGRAMLRVTSRTPVPLTPAEAELDPAPEPKLFSAVAEEWNERTAAIRSPRTKTVTRLAFAGIIGFIGLFGLNILTQPIRFAPLELVSINNGAPATGFVLFQGASGVFIPAPDGAAQFVSAADITSRQLCDDAPHWWTISIADILDPQVPGGVDCSS
ncbi:hypothetical protein [Herbiconiux solani]|uniref:hypothetical protein n=1 Tax=Herbiconiux solani TaxID=661329 RepID=UPI0008244A65|nr:hypothetical protein [Herbiconiux solani]